MMKLSERILNAPAGHTVDSPTFVEGQKGIDETILNMALQYVETKKGAEKIYYAELAGRKRPGVLATAIRRMDDFNRPIIPKTEATSERTVA